MVNLTGMESPATRSAMARWMGFSRLNSIFLAVLALERTKVIQLERLRWSKSRE
jgi:hypothetical protein